MLTLLASCRRWAKVCFTMFTFYFLCYLRGSYHPLPLCHSPCRDFAACVAIVVAKFGVKICILFTAYYNAPIPLFPPSRVSLVHFPSGYKFMAYPCTMKKAFRRFTTILRNLFWFITKVFFSGVIVDSFFIVPTSMSSSSPRTVGQLFSLPAANF